MMRESPLMVKMNIKKIYLKGKNSSRSEMINLITKIRSELIGFVQDFKSFFEFRGMIIPRHLKSILKSTLVDIIKA